MESSPAPSSASPGEPDYAKLGALLDVLQRLGADEELEQETIDAAVAGVFSDFRLFCSLLEIRLKSRDQVPFTYADWHDEQKAFERDRCGRDIVLKARQIGTSTLELARDFWFAVVNRGVSVQVIVHDDGLADQMFLTLRIFADCLQALGLLPRKRYSTKREIVFADTGSAVRIVESGETNRSASKKGRSGTIHRLHATEVAFWGAAAETMAAVLSAVPEDGEIVIESTANGAGGMFYENVQASRAGRSGYKLHFYPWFRHRTYRAAIPADFDPAPRDEHEERLRELGCNNEQIAWWRAKVDDPGVGLDKALQEYPIDVDTCFRASGRAWIEPDLIDKLVKHIRPPRRMHALIWKAQRFGELRIFSEPERGEEYVVFGDVAEGVASDGSSATVLKRRTCEQVAAFWSDTVAPGDFGTVLCLIGTLYNTAKAAAERNNHGHAALERMQTVMQYPNLFVHDDGRIGWNTTPATRPIMWDDMAAAIRSGAAAGKVFDAETIAEARTIIVDDDGKPRARGKKKKAKDACKDDRFVSLAGAWQLLSVPTWSTSGINVRGL